MKKLVSFLNKNNIKVLSDYDKVTESMVFIHKDEKYYLDPQFNMNDKVMWWEIRNLKTREVVGIGDNQKQLIEIIQEKLI